MEEKIPLKEVFRYLFVAFGITMVAWLVTNCLTYILIKQNIKCQILMAPPWDGRGFELPFLETGFNLFTWMRSLICDFFEKFVGLFWYDRLHFSRKCFIGPFIDEIGWRGFFWLTRKHSEKIWWKIGSVISAVLFALWHDRGMVFILVPFAIAISNSLLIAATKCFWPAWVNHALCNIQLVLADRVIR